MPQASVASVWDWQFLLPESRATVWVFSLTRGDDCDGTPLPRGEPALAAAEGQSVQVSTDPLPDAQPTTLVDSNEAPLETVADATPSSAFPEPGPEAGPGASEAILAEPMQTVTEPAELRVASTETSDAAISGSEAAAPDPLATAAVAPADEATAADDADAAETAIRRSTVASVDPEMPPAGPAGAPALAIDFDINSSYFSAAATRELRAFLDGLPAEGPVEIELAGAVGTSGVRGASDEEAQRYNEWMAERRIERVAEWLQANAGDRRLTLAERLVENDPSRQVRLRVDGGSR
jgi:hypothetical protein